MSKVSHSFCPDVAAAVGLNAAVIFQHLIFQHTFSIDRKEYWDGHRYWIKKTARSFALTYPYLSQKEIRGALDRLEKEGYIVSVAGLSENKFDRAKSFSIEEKGFDLMEMTADERHVFTCDKRANACYPKGKSDVTQRANQMLPKGQMNNSYNSYSDFNDIDKMREEKQDQPPKSQKIETADEARAVIAAWLNEGNEETVKAWYSELKIKYERSEFKVALIKFCSNYMTSSDDGFVQRFQKDPVKFFRNRFALFLPTCLNFDAKSKPKPSTQPAQQQAVYTPPLKRF